MTPQDLIADLRSRINPQYAAQRGTESYKRRLCAEALEALIVQRDDLLAACEKAVPYIQAAGVLIDLGDDLKIVNAAIASAKGGA